MPDDRPATELWDALRRGVYRSAGLDVAIDGYPELLAALEAWHLFYEVHLDSCPDCGHEELCEVGLELQATALKLLREALATERARLLEALNA